MRFNQFPQHPPTDRRRQSGQTLVMFVFFLVVLVLFLGLAIDLGFAYITKGQLSKAVDSACLAGMVSLGQGTNQAAAVAASTFYANYTMTNEDGGPVRPVITLSQDNCTVPNQYITVTATAPMKTFFVRVLPNWATLPVNDLATATRQHLIVSLVLDRSGSMNPSTGTTKGGAYLPGAVTDFISNFSEQYDEAAMASFASTASTDIQMTNTFKASISTAASNLVYSGGTFSVGGLVLGSNQLASVNVPTCEYAVKALVFFTDGAANMIQQELNCPPNTPWNFGGYDGTTTQVGFWHTNDNASEQSTPDCYLVSGGSPSLCGGQNYFTTMGGSQQPFLRANVTAEAEAEGVSLAQAMQENGWYVFCVGLSADPNDPVNQNFLLEVANDPTSPTHNGNLPEGEALIATDPSQLDGLFNQIAQQILLRLTK